MMFKTLITSSLAAVASADDKANFDWNQMASSRSSNGADYGTFMHFDTNYMAMMLGTHGKDGTVLHQANQLPKVGLTSMEKVTAMTAVSTRANIRKQLVSLLKAQVRIESMYNTKKEKLYMSASSVYNFISRLLHNACTIALSNDGLWKEQMQCFTAYKQLLEVYSMWNGVRDVVFALEHGMSVNEQSLAVCGSQASLKEHFVAQDDKANRLQNQYLVSATMRSCYDNLQIRIEALRRWLSSLLVSMETDSDRAQSCMFKVITVLTCLSSGNQENVLDLAIKEEHKQHTVYSFSRYSSMVLKDAVSGNGASKANMMQETTGDAQMMQNATAAASFIEIKPQGTMREVRPM